MNENCNSCMFNKVSGNGLCGDNFSFCPFDGKKLSSKEFRTLKTEVIVEAVLKELSYAQKKHPR